MLQTHTSSCRSQPPITNVLRALVAAVCAFPLIAIPAHAKEKTPANAYEFIRSSMTDGSWGGNYEYCYYNDVMEGDTCVGDGAPIRSIYFAENSYCVITFQMDTSGSPTRTIDLRKNFEIYISGGAIQFNGTVRMSNGDTRTSWAAWSSNYDMMNRVEVALEYLQGVCKPDAGPW